MKGWGMVLAIALLGKGYAAAQVNVRASIRFKDTIKVDHYQVEKNGFSSLKIKMAPGSHEILNLQDLDFLSTQTITGVDLVYSDYPKNEDFTELNRNRVLELFILLPEAFNQPQIEWRLIKQINVNSAMEMQKHYHGFVVYYRPMPTFAEENATISNIMNGVVAPADSTLLKVFTRNKTWKDMLVVCDVTGSMSPYTAQILLWLKANAKLKTFKQAVFFNDDDEKSTDQKVKSDSTGMWAVDTKNDKKILETALTAMQKGSHIENNLEAIFYAVKKYPENKQNIVMIADNWETPCDMRLLELLKKEKIPVHIIICGVTDRINTSYLDIAYATGGSVHTMEEDLQSLAQLGEGKEFKFNGLKLKMTGGKFVQL